MKKIKSVNGYLNLQEYDGVKTGSTSITLPAFSKILNISMEGTGIGIVYQYDSNPEEKTFYIKAVSGNLFDVEIEDQYQYFSTISIIEPYLVNSSYSSSINLNIVNTSRQIHIFLWEIRSTLEERDYKIKEVFNDSYL